MSYPTKEKIKEIELAYALMKSRGWGFVSNGRGFGDPMASFTAIGPYDGTLVQVIYVDKDPVKAVRRAIEISDGKTSMSKKDKEALRLDLKKAKEKGYLE